MPIDPELAEALAQAARNARENTTERDRLIREAYASGKGSVREIARIAGLHNTTVHAIIDKGGQPRNDEESTEES